MTNTRYFKNVATLEELKQEYKRLARRHHPDLGGNTKTMQAIIGEYDRIFAALKQAEAQRIREAQIKQKANTTAERSETRRKHKVVWYYPVDIDSL